MIKVEAYTNKEFNLEGYKISRSGEFGSEYVCMQTKEDGYLSVFEMRGLAKHLHFGGKDFEEARSEVRKYAARRVKELRTEREVRKRIN